MFILSNGGDDTFQSTLPAGEATTSAKVPEASSEISIHASRGGSDQANDARRMDVANFNPRFPRGKRQYGQTVP